MSDHYNAHPKRLVCLASFASKDQLERLYQCTERNGGFISTRPLGCYYYIHEDRACLLYLIDGHLEPVPMLDYYA